MKKLVVLSLTMLLLVSLIGCATQNRTSTADTQQPVQTEQGSSDDGQIIKIGIVNRTLKEFCYVYMRDKMFAYAEQESPNIQLEWVACDSDIAMQMSQVEDFIQKGYDVIVIEPEQADACNTMVQACKDANIYVINMCGAIEGAVVDGRCNLDDYGAGYLQVEKFAEIFEGENPKAVVIGGAAGDECSLNRLDGINDACEKYGVEIILQQEHKDWDRSLAMNTMENALVQYSDIDVVFACNDNMMHGCIKAAKNVERFDEIYFFGCDWDPDTAEMLLPGDVKNVYVVAQDLEQMGIDMIVMAQQLVKGEELTYNEEINGIKTQISPVNIVGWDNVKEEVEMKYPEYLG